MCESGKQQLTISLYVRRPILEMATGLPACELVFDRDAHGKLILCTELGWEFNVADTLDCVVLAVSCNQAIGVDVERADRRVVNLSDFITACLSPAEQDQLQSCAAHEQTSWVLRAWVLKEAYTKRIGLGLSYGFSRITVDPEAEQPLISLANDTVDPSDCMALWTNHLNHYIGLSVEGAVADLRVRLMSESDFGVC
jgi:phosphopantetheine--protein transferase-like protein